MKNPIQNITLLSLMALLLGGCASSKSLQINTRPTGSDIKINGVPMGTTPIVYEYKPQIESIGIEVAKEGFITKSEFLSTSSPEAKSGSYLIALAENPIYSETTTSRATNVWLRVQISERLQERDAWQRIIDSVTSTYDSLEQLDPQSGYLRSTSKQKRWEISTEGVYIVRTQLIASMASVDPLIYKFKIKSEISRGVPNDWKVYERVFRDDAEMIEELTNRLGLK